MIYKNLKSLKKLIYIKKLIYDGEIFFTVDTTVT
jgi:hypothetical protein